MVLILKYYVLYQVPQFIFTFSGPISTLQNLYSSPTDYKSKQYWQRVLVVQEDCYQQDYDNVFWL